MFRFGLSEDGKIFQAIKFEGHSGIEQPPELHTSKDRVAVVIDVETTGLNPATDKIIEVAARKIAFDKNSGEIVWIGEHFQALQEIDEPLPPFITKLTGLTDEDLEGQKIDWTLFDHFIEDAVILLAHNAGFDRPFVDQLSKQSPNKIWGCTASQINWKQWFPSGRQEILALYHGFFYDAHRGLNDVDALIKLIGFSAPEGGKNTYLLNLLENAKKPFYLVYASNSPYETKDILRRNSYRWNGKVWSKRVQESQLEAEKNFLITQVYAGKGFLGEVKAIKAKDNFKVA